MEWQVYIRTCKEVLGLDPSKAIDAAGLSTKKSSAFIASLGFTDNPRHYLKHARRSLEHCSATFIGDLKTRDLLQLHCTHLSIWSKEHPLGHLVIASGNMAEWQQAVLMGCRNCTSVSYRKHMTEVYLALEATGYGIIWSDYKKEVINPDEIIFK